MISVKDLRDLAVILVSILRFLEGTWTMDPYREKCVRRALDDLGHLHGSPSLGQLTPGFVTVRVYVLDQDLIDIDLDRIRTDLGLIRRGQDVVFDVRVVAVARDGSGATAYVIGWDELRHTGPRLHKTKAELATTVAPLPLTSTR
jgi:hypothetical protein